jgi:hypothetical protein
MTTSIFKSVRSYFVYALALGIGVALVTSACDSPGDLGDACVAAESHNDCSGNMVCFQPYLCANTYCCDPPPSGDLVSSGPNDVSPSANPNCATGCNGGAKLICEDIQANGVGFDGVTADLGDAACQFADASPFDGGPP